MATATTTLSPAKRWSCAAGRSRRWQRRHPQGADKIAIRVLPALAKTFLKYRLADRPGGRRHTAVGDHVHVHNVRTRLEGVEGYSFAPAEPEYRHGGPASHFRRAIVARTGRAGTRNEITGAVHRRLRGQHRPPYRREGQPALRRPRRRGLRLPRTRSAARSWVTATWPTPAS
ncbi:hypothetical protein ACRAWD_19570 [Caulobacter segnis]